MNNHSDILQFTQELFPSPKYTIYTEKDGYILVKDEKNKMCIKFIIFGKEMDISDIAKCHQMSGSKSLVNLLEISKRFNVTNIQLVDAATIWGDNCNFRVYLMQILSTGNSWYNKHGFISENYQKELSDNLPLLRMTVGEFIQKYIERFNKYQTFGYALSDYKKNIVIAELQKMPELFDKSVQDLTREIIARFMKTGVINCNIPILKWFTFLLVLAEQLVNYKTDLFFEPVKKEEIEGTLLYGGSKRKTRNGIRRKPRKSKKSKKSKKSRK